MQEHEQVTGEQPGNGAPEITITQRPPDAGLEFDDDFAEDLLDDGEEDTSEWTATALDDYEDEDEDEVDDYEDDRFANLIDIAGQAGAVLSAPPSETDERLRRLEAAAAELAAAEVNREGKRVRRKVTAATAGAGAAGFIPIVLQLTDALALDPTIAATVAACASLVGAFAAGWFTPERQPPLPNSTAQELLTLAKPPR
jgi:hypothetical protein